MLQPLIMITGKGGVGKSFVATLLAKKLADQGKKTLLVEMVPESYLSKTLNLRPQGDGFFPQSTPYGFDWSVWTGEACLSDYVRFWVKVPWVSKAFLNNPAVKSLVQMAPGLREISFLGKLTSQQRQHGPPMDYDHIVIDAVSTGHYLSLLKAPEGLSQVVTSGPMREQSEGILRVLNDSQLFRTLVVANLENFSISETKEFEEQYRTILKSSLGFVANKVYPVPSELMSMEFEVKTATGAFIATQKEIKIFQEAQMERLREISPSVDFVPFYFEKLKDVLGKQDEIRRLFSKF